MGKHAGPTANVQDLVTCPDTSGGSNGLAQAPKIAGTKQDS
jgi:hypothetical protein